MTEITLFEFTYIPFERGPIRACKLLIEATNRKEAELIALTKGHRFFEQNCTCEVKEVLRGYQDART